MGHPPGKTTLFGMMVGEETPDEGAVSVHKKLTDRRLYFPGTTVFAEFILS